MISFENCEVAYVPARAIQNFSLNRVTKSYTLSQDDEIFIYYEAHAGYLHLNIEAIKNIKTEMLKESLYERLREYNDIVSLTLIDKQGKETEIYVPDPQEDNSTNGYAYNENNPLQINKVQEETLYGSPTLKIMWNTKEGKYW